MIISATYICPIRGLASLEPPEPTRLRQALMVAKDLGLERLRLVILEECLLQSSPRTVHYLDGLLRAMDQIADAGVTAHLIFPAQRILGLTWAPPYLVRGSKDPGAKPVFVDRKVRRLWPFDWWKDMPILEKRIKIFRELMTSVHGHPALKGWLILDRFLEWAQPPIHAADLILKSFLAEIREKDEHIYTAIGMGWHQLMNPDINKILFNPVDGLHIGTVEHPSPRMKVRENEPAELLIAAYLCALSTWLFRRPVEIEIGGSLLDQTVISDHLIDAGRTMAFRGVTGVNWVSLIDPEPPLCSEPPWVLRSGLEGIGLLTHLMEPKAWIESWISETRSVKPAKDPVDFINISRDAYSAEPQTHFFRLWDHFYESLS